MYTAPGSGSGSAKVQAAANGMSNSAAVSYGSAPAAPSNLTATSVASRRVVLSWTDNSSNETGFVIQRSSNGNSWSQVGTVGAGVTTYTDNGVSKRKTYYYRVYAYNSFGNSAYSNTVKVVTPNVGVGAHAAAGTTNAGAGGGSANSAVGSQAGVGTAGAWAGGSASTASANAAASAPAGGRVAQSEHFAPASPAWVTPNGVIAFNSRAGDGDALATSSLTGQVVQLEHSAPTGQVGTVNHRPVGKPGWMLWWDW
jgi:hypothetical protein